MDTTSNSTRLTANFMAFAIFLLGFFIFLGVVLGEGANILENIQIEPSASLFAFMLISISMSVFFFFGTGFGAKIMSFVGIGAAIVFFILSFLAIGH